MISVVHNKVLKAVEILLDEAGIDLLIKKLQTLKKVEHLHLYATNDNSGVCTKSPYGHAEVFGELVFTTLPADAWDDNDLRKKSAPNSA